MENEASEKDSFHFPALVLMLTVTRAVECFATAISVFSWH